MTSPSQRSAQEQFGRTAARYSTSLTHSGNDSLVDLRDFLAGSPERFRTAVDVGTGPGFTAFAIAPFAERVIATDLTPQMLEQVRALRGPRGAPDTEMALAAAETLPFLDGTVDLLTCRTAAHHFVDVALWLREVRRVLRPGGLLIVGDTCAPEDPATAAWMQRIELERDPSHVRNLAPSEWSAAVEEAGLGVTDTVMSYVHLQYPDWAERAGMSNEAMAALQRAMLKAPPAAKAAFAIEPHEDGTIDFHWDVVVVRAVKDGGESV